MMNQSTKIATKQLPVNFGPLKGAQAHSRFTGPCGDTMEYWLRIEGGRIQQATFTTDGCGASIASGSMAAAMIEGKTLSEADQFAPDEVLRALGGLAAEHVHCPILAVKTVKAALADYRAGHISHAGELSKPACETEKQSVFEAKPAPIQPRGSHALPPGEEQVVQSHVARIAFKIVVLSGKGGVGKSTVAANLAISLAASGKRVGLMDVDVHGPSIPMLLGVQGRKPDINGHEIHPIRINDQLKAMSIGFLLESSHDAVVWRGPMKYSFIKELLSGVVWGDLDVLVVDAPPGTGDEPLAVAQLIGRPAAAIVVTTPQQMSVADVRRSVTFCRQAGLPVLGIVENMSGYSCPKCGDATPLFKTGGGSMLAQEMNIPFLGAIPIDPQIVEAGDSGEPFVDRLMESPSARAFARLLPPIFDALKAHVHHTNENTNSKQITMKIAIPLSGGLLSEHFGHCEQFAIVEADMNSKTILSTNLLTPPPHEPGLLPKWLREQGVVTVIAGGIGQKALNIFAQNGILVRAGITAAPVYEIATAFLQGELTGTPQGCAHHGHGNHHQHHHECGK